MKRRRRRRSPSSSPPPKPPRASAGSALARWIALIVGLVAIGASTWLFVLYPSERGPGEGRAVEVEVSADANAIDLARVLSAAGLVSNVRVFALWVRASGGAHRVVAGAHLLTDDASPRELMARLERGSGGASSSARITFPEGWNRFEMARRLQDKHVVSLRAFLDATTDGALLRGLGLECDSAEGFLFPTTYDFRLDSDAREVVRRMKREFDRRWDAAARAHGATLDDVMASAKMSVRDVVTLASMVEKEAQADDERATIASVFLNRLRDPAFHPKRLECDPTAAYGCLVAPDKAASCASFTGKPSAAIQHDAGNAYSTYTHEGLPPGPIANPGAKSLEAAMAPASTRYLFFVARGDGRHTFSETFDAHLAAVHGR